MTFTRQIAFQQNMHETKYQNVKGPKVLNQMNGVAVDQRSTSCVFNS